MDKANTPPIANLVSTGSDSITDDFNALCCIQASRSVACADAIVGVNLIADYATYTGATSFGVAPDTNSYNLKFIFDPSTTNNFWIYASTTGSTGHMWWVNGVQLSLPTAATAYAWYKATANCTSGIVNVQPNDNGGSRIKYVYFGTTTPTTVPTACTSWSTSGICGDNRFGQLGIGSLPNQGGLTGLSGFSNFTKLVSSRFHTLALVSSSTLYVMGGNRFGELGLGDMVARATATKMNTLPSGLLIADIAAGGMHSIIVLTDGRVMTFGRNTHGQLCNGNRVGFVTVPTLVSGITLATKASAGWAHSAVVTSDFKLYMCGSNAKGQLGQGTAQTEYLTPVLNPTLPNVTDVSCGTFHTLVRTGAIPKPTCCSGSVRHYTCADSSIGITSESSGFIMRSPSFTPISSSTPPSQTTYSANFTFTPIAGAYVWVMIDRSGTNNSRWFVNGVSVQANANSPGLTWYQVTSAVVSAGKVTIQPRDTDTNLRAVYYGTADPSLLAIPCDPQVMSFGANAQGQLCSGNTDPRFTPAVIPRLNHLNFLGFSAGSYHSIFLVQSTDTSTVLRNAYGCGLNNVNQLGVNTGGSNAMIPIVALGTKSITQVVAGYQHTAFLAQDKLLLTSGANTNGQLAAGDFGVKTSAALMGYVVGTAILGGGGDVTAISYRA
eukprot:c11992_g1_i1.p1 GENE.c11992_g1_i1~~c11992_g1_i1.p1  ORF type:complete len:778 (-),score=193.82 c11992_g1_i1:131-2122(-)